jgi:hypothetical protein
MLDRLFTAVTVMAITLQTAAVVMIFAAITTITLESFQIIPGPF